MTKSVEDLLTRISRLRRAQLLRPDKTDLVAAKRMKKD